LGIEPHEYKRMGQFKEKVLHLAIEQINDHTDIKADYEQHKKGRSIVGFSFSFKQKTKPKPVKQQRDPDTLDMFCDMSDAQIKTYSSILSKVHSISDLAGNKDYSAFAVWIGNVLRDPASVREETAKRVFKALRTETDFKG
ncbi:replication initiation protein, partial [Acinetobacter pittii]